MLPGALPEIHVHIVFLQNLWTVSLGLKVLPPSRGKEAQKKRIQLCSLSPVRNRVCLEHTWASGCRLHLMPLRWLHFTPATSHQEYKGPAAVSGLPLDRWPPCGLLSLSSLDSVLQSPVLGRVFWWLRREPQSSQLKLRWGGEGTIDSYRSRNWSTVGHGHYSWEATEAAAGARWSLLSLLLSASCIITSLFTTGFLCLNMAMANRTPPCPV